ncbi:hypothetical protein GCM10020254_31730 [Streptomyces goshikiensis]
MRTEDFEAVARIAAGEREGTRLEFIDGVIRSKAMPDGDHQMIIQWLTRICMQHRPELWLHGGPGGSRLRSTGGTGHPGCGAGAFQGLRRAG